MSFSERMKESLGTEGARVTVEPPANPVAPGESAATVVTIHGGTRDARVDAVVVRVIEAKRSWTTSDGQPVSEADAQSMDRRQMMPTWERRVIHQVNVDVGELVAAHAEHEVPVDVLVPGECSPTNPAVVVTVNAQADIKEQIDPTGTATLVVG